MSKVKQWAWDEAEKAVDKIILQVKQNLITKETAAKDIMKVDKIVSYRHRRTTIPNYSTRSD